MGVIVAIVMALIAMAIIMGLSSKSYAKAAEKAPDAICKESIRLRAQHALTAETDLASIEIKIPNQCEVQSFLDIKGSKDEVQEFFARQMAKCWDRYGEGRYEQALEDSDVKYLPKLLGMTENQCQVCYVMLVERESEGGSITAEDFAHYLRTEEHFDYKETYMDYFQFHGGPGRVAVVTPEIETGVTYAISFMAKNDDGDDEWLSALGKATGGVALGAATIACTAVTGGVCGAGALIIGLGTSAALIDAGLSEAEAAEAINTYVVDKIYKHNDRDTSIVILDTLERTQQHCFSDYERT